MHAPTGANLALNTSFPLLGMSGNADHGWSSGPLDDVQPVCYGWLLASSALSMYWVLRRYCDMVARRRMSGGLLYGFSAYEIGHATQAFVPHVYPAAYRYSFRCVDKWLVADVA